MCIIVVKKSGVKMPTKKEFKNCFDANSDGSGYMFAVNGKVHIVKGLMTFNSFKKSLDENRKKYGDNIPYVFHFRISTQGGIQKSLCHPYPLSDDMEALKKLNVMTNIGVAHNGIIDLTSNWRVKEYNDTMLFITDYLSELVKNRNDLIRFRTLIERLTSGSRLAILFNDGNVELTGSGWVEENGVFYSNTSYKTYHYKKSYSKSNWCYQSLFDDDCVDSYDYNQYDYKDEEWNYYWDGRKKQYLFDEMYCPLTIDNDGRYCEHCANKNNCEMYKWLKGEND